MAFSIEPKLMEPNGRVVDDMVRSILRGGDTLLSFTKPLHPRNNRRG